MKLFSKFISAGLSLLIVMSCSTAFAGEAKTKKQTKLVRCNNASCVNVQNVLKKCGVGKNCKVTKITKGYCPDGNCSTKKASVSKTESSQPSVTTKSNEFKTDYESEVIRLVNDERAKQGLKKLIFDDGASKAAHIRAKEIVKSFSHTRPDGTSCFTAAKEAGVTYRTAGENIAYGYKTPAQVVTGWMKSEGHRKNILSSSFSKIGVACFENSGTLYWSQFFIG